MDIVEALVPNPLRADSLTAAAAYRVIDQSAPILLWDEGDNLDLPRQNKLRTVFNSGHQRGHKILISAPGDGVRSYDTFAPLMYAGIGSLPLPQLARSIALHMERSRVLLQTFSLRRNPETQRMGSAVFRYLFDWATIARPTLDLDPPMPTQLRNRVADNWRTLLTMADACGRGECSRAAALEFNKGYHDEDAVVILLGDIRDIFNRLRTDVLHSATLVAELLALEDGMIPWAEWRGVRNNQQPRKLTSSELARLLQAFQIRPRSIWLRERREGENESSKKGYRREQFENAWARYCPEDDGTPTQGDFELCSF